MTMTTQHRMKILGPVAAACLWVCAGCKLLPEYHTDEGIAFEGETFVVLDSSALSPAAFATNGVLNSEARALINQRLLFLERFTADANSWFLPVAASYLPNIDTLTTHRLVPVAGDVDAPLTKAHGAHALAVNLNAAAWNSSSQVTTTLRFDLIRPVVENAVRSSTEASDQPQKAKTLQRIFIYGVSSYLSSFGMTVEKTPMALAMSGDRRYMEDLFAVVRGDVRGDVPENEKSDAFKNVGLWMCYEIESASGNDALIESVNEGPEAFYRQYLTTRQGILLTLEPLPVQTRPVPDSLITH